jgi:hypothetical protein
VSILSAHGVRIEDISNLVGHSGTTVAETVYRHEIRPALTGATAMDKILAKERTHPQLLIIAVFATLFGGSMPLPAYQGVAA